MSVVFDLVYRICDDVKAQSLLPMEILTSVLKIDTNIDKYVRLLPDGHRNTVEINSG